MHTLNKFFTPIDELAKQEPEYFTRGVCEVPDSGKTELAKTPVMYLEEAAKKIYDCAPVFNTISQTGESSNPTFVLECRLKEMVSKGEGKTKKTAKHLAAAEMLRIIVKKDLKYGPKLGIPHSSVAESLAFIDSLSELRVGSPTDATVETAGFDRTVNYVGQLQETCQKNKVEAPVYSDMEEGSVNDITYVCKCEIAKMSSEGKARKKKDAKAIAAYNMLKMLETSLSDYKKDIDENELEEDSAAEPAGEEASADPGATLEDILSDQEKFSLYSLDYKDLNKHDTFGMRQCLLKITIVKAGDTQESILVFPGVGDTFEEAHENASTLALENLTMH